MAELFGSAAHAGDVRRAPRIGQAVDDELRIVELGLWLDPTGRVTRARWKATTCVGLMAVCERACQLLEAGHDPAALDAETLAREVRGLHPLHHRRAELVLTALHRALASEPNKEQP